jgi:hypothetical protein
VTNSTIELFRDGISSVKPTTGELQIEGEHFCWTLEDPWLDNAVGKSCIPTGTYRVVLSLSTRFRRDMPRLIGVPGRLGILVHPGNTDADTEGCILVGDARSGGEVLQSQLAFGRFLQWFASVGNDSYITIWNPTPAVPPSPPYQEWSPSAP